MSYEAKVICDSMSEKGTRLVTIEATFPRFILAEMNTHRDFSRNSASSRAVPIQKMIDRVKTDPVIPSFGKNQKGMQAGEQLDGDELADAELYWFLACRNAIDFAEYLAKLGVHKQVVNRLLEPFAWHTAIITSSRWNNFFEQRCHPDAQPEMQTIANLMRSALYGSTPKQLREGQWHLPYIQDDERNKHDEYALAPIATARCARVSYLTHDGVRDTKKDHELFRKLLTSGHWSPFEHVAYSCYDADIHEHGNLEPGWVQYRKTFRGEYRF